MPTITHGSKGRRKSGLAARVHVARGLKAQHGQVCLGCVQGQRVRLDGCGHIAVAGHAWCVDGLWFAFPAAADFLDKHPGGKEMLLLSVGRDVTELIQSYHPFSTLPEKYLAARKVSSNPGFCLSSSRAVAFHGRTHACSIPFSALHVM